MHGLMREGWHPVATIRLVRHRQTKGAGTDRPCLRSSDACSLLYPFSRPHFLQAEAAAVCVDGIVAHCGTI